MNIGGFVTPESHKDMVATITPVTSDQGEVTTMKFMNQVKQTFATANGTQGVATSATLNLEGDDLYGFTMSDGTQSYTLNPVSLILVTLPAQPSLLKQLKMLYSVRISRQRWILMVMCSSEEMMVGKLFFNPLPLQLEKPVVGLLEVVKGCCSS